jgi:TRAP-type mannitol/chloroaromatic compound transport system permease small subunit
MAVESFVSAVDRFSTFIGKAFAWMIVGLTLAICYEVFARYLFRAPTTWAFDVSYMLYGTLFMCAGAYTMARSGHVRADFLYRMAPPRMQALLDLVLYLLFFFPAMIALVWFGWDFFLQSFHQNERSSFSPVGPYIWPFKFVIPAVGALMILQGIAEVLRCILTISSGQWPRRAGDVKEMEEIALELAEKQRLAETAR